MAGRVRHHLQNALVRGLIGGAMLLPYRWRVPLFGWLVRRLVAPLAGWPRRIRTNLAQVWPELPAAAVRRIVSEVADNVGRTVIEIYSGPEFVARAAAIPPGGPGMAALAAAHEAGRPVVLVTGHFGNYDAARAALVAHGFPVGALYMPMRNPAFNRHYEAAISRIATPLFPRGRQGLAAMVRHLRGGGMLGMLIDQHMGHGEQLSFFGAPAWTALSAADLALRHDALLVPVYGVRRPDGLSFDIVVEAPIPHSTPAAMTQALNDSLEALVRRHPGQWFWVHRRWKDGPVVAGQTALVQAGPALSSSMPWHRRGR